MSEQCIGLNDIIYAWRIFKLAFRRFRLFALQRRVRHPKSRKEEEYRKYVSLLLAQPLN